MLYNTSRTVHRRQSELRLFSVGDEAISATQHEPSIEAIVTKYGGATLPHERASA